MQTIVNNSLLFFFCLLQTNSHEEGTESIVTNTDQGNTVAGELLKNLLGNIKTFRTQLETIEEQLKKSVSQKDIADVKEMLEDHVTKFQKHCEEAAMRQDMQSKIECLSNENEKLRSELEATKKDYDKKIMTLSEAMESKLSTKENELRSELKAMKKEYDEQIRSLSVKIHQPPNVGEANGSAPIVTLLSTLDELAGQMVPKETTNKRRSIIESHDNEVRTAHVLQDSFDDSVTESACFYIPRTNSGSSSGIGTLSRNDSSKRLSNIDEDEPSKFEDQGPLQAAEQSLPKVLLRQKTSTPTANRTKSISEKDHNYLGVIWAMSDLTVAIKKLLETAESNN